MSQWRLPGAVDNRPTFFAHALALAAAYGPGPWPDGGYPLPDQQVMPVMSGSVNDGVRTHHFSFKVDAPSAARAATVINAIIDRPPESEALQQLHDLLADGDTLVIADELGKRITGANRGRVRELGRWLVEYGTRRNAVAAGLVLVGLAGDERDRELLLLMGSMEELTLYAVVALARTQDDRDMAIFELARRVRAWGRVQAVERLEGTTDPEIKAWLLRDGCHNDVLDEYLAHIAATTGDLAGALRESEVDDELLDGASRILGALARTGGPAKDMTDYPDATVAIDRYLTLVRNRPSLPRIRAVLHLQAHLADDARCAELLADLDWLDMLRQAVNSTDYDTFTSAIWPARRLGLRIHDQVKAWLELHPYNGYLWVSLDDTEESVRLAERLLPLDELAEGPPSAEPCVGHQFQTSNALETVVGRFSHRSWPLVRTALANEMTSTRRAAVRTLKSWPRDSLPADALDTVTAASVVEPHDNTREAILELLEAWSR